MFARVHSAAVLGVDGYIVEVETDLEFKLPSFATVGFAEGAVRESKERVTSAIKNSGFPFPQKRVTINLAPADIKKKVSVSTCRLQSEFSPPTGVFPPTA